MTSSEKSTRSRRNFLASGWQWLRLLLLGGLLYPLLEFLKFRIPRQPREVIVPRQVKVGGYYAGPDFVLFQGEERVWAVSRICTHLGCRLNYHEKDQLLICPCHQSRFTPEGLRVSGPAERNLPRHPVEIMPEGQGYVVVL